MELKDFLKDGAYILIALIAYMIKYYKDKRNAIKNTETQTVKMEQLARKIAEDQRIKAEETVSRLQKELADSAARMAEIAARDARDRELRKGIELAEKIDKDVRHSLRKILNLFKAQRAYVIHFSNGTITAAGIHLMKITFQSEVIETHEVEQLSSYFKEISIPEMFKSPLTLILAGGRHYIKSTEELSTESPVRRDYKDWLLSYRVRSVLWVPMRNNSGEIVAIMVMHWFATTNFTDVELSKIRDMKSEIESIYNRLTTQSPEKLLNRQ